MKKETGLSDDSKAATNSNSAEALPKIDEAANKDETANGTKDNTENVEKPNEAPTASSFSWSSFVGGISSALTNTVASVKDSFKSGPAAPAIEVEKSFLRRKIHQAITVTRSSTEPVEREDNYDGPTAMVLVKDPLSPWESMKARLRSNPAINDLLKRGWKVTQAASETGVGKRVGAVGQIVQDKISVSERVQFPIM